jgi:hypothetical protein
MIPLSVAGSGGILTRLHVRHLPLLICDLPLSTITDIATHIAARVTPAATTHDVARSHRL